MENPNAIVSRHRLSNAEAVVCADGSASLLNVVYRDGDMLEGNGTCPHPLRPSDEAKKRYDAYPELVKTVQMWLRGIEELNLADGWAIEVSATKKLLKQLGESV